LWPRVKVGLLLVFIGACVLGGAAVILTISTLLQTILTIKLMSGSVSGSMGMVNTVHTMNKIVLLLGLGATITAMVGYVFSMLGPNKRGTMGLAIATLAVAGTNLLLSLIFQLPTVFDSHNTPLTGFASWFFAALIPGLLLGSEFILFTLYLQAVSRVLKSSEDARQAMNVMVLACIFTGLRALSDIIAYASIPSTPFSPPSKGMIWLALILSWAILGVYITMLVFYILRVWRTRALVR
jgi:hypothetical protein